MRSLSQQFSPTLQLLRDKIISEAQVGRIVYLERFLDKMAKARGLCSPNDLAFPNNKDGSNDVVLAAAQCHQSEVLIWLHKQGYPLKYAGTYAVMTGYGIAERTIEDIREFPEAVDVSTLCAAFNTTKESLICYVREVLDAPSPFRR